MDGLGPTQIVSSESTQFSTEADMQIVRTLLRDPLYKIPEHIRDTIVTESAKMLGGDSPKFKAIGARLLLEMDKRNLELLRLVVPRKVEHIDVKQKTTAELIEIVERAKALMPPMAETIDAEYRRTS